MDFRDAVTCYLRSLKTQGRSAKTCKNHRQALAVYERWVSNAQLDWKEVNEGEFADYLATFAEAHTAATTRIYRCTLTAFYALAAKSGWVARSPVATRVAQRPSRLLRLPAVRTIDGVDPLFVQAIDDFYKRILTRGLSEDTARQYEYLLVQFGRYLSTRRRAYTAVTSDEIEMFLDHYRADRQRPSRPGSRYGHTRSATTVALMDNCLRSFYHWAARNGRVPSSPAAYLDAVRRDKPLPRVVKKQVILDLLDKLNHPPEELDAAARWRWQRNRMVILVFLFTGLRLSECASLTWETTDLDEATVLIRRKGGNEQLVPLHAALVAELRAYKGAATRGYLFRSYRNEQLGAHGISEMFRSFVQGELGIICTAHRLRHTFATTLLRQGADLLAIQKLLGHASVKTTQVYAEIEDSAPARALELLPRAWSEPPADTPPAASAEAEGSGPPPAQISWDALGFLTRTQRKAA